MSNLSTRIKQILSRSGQIATDHKLAAAAFLVLVGIVFAAIFAPAITPYEVGQYDYTRSHEPPSRDHLLGTDRVGRDILTRVIFAARLSLLVAVLAVSLGSLLGIIMGMLAGFFGSWVETLIMRIVDVGLSFPLIMLAILITAFFGGGLVTLVVAIGLSRAPRMARIVHAATRQVSEIEYITAARGVGNSTTRILVRHVLPNITAPIIIRATLDFAIVILLESALSFLGLGIPPPTPSWGGLISTGRGALRRAPWVSISGGAAIFVTLLSANLVGDGLRDLLDPKVGPRRG